MLEGTIPDGKARLGGIKLANLKALTNGTICPGNPDIFYGARPEQIKVEVRETIGDIIIPSTQHDHPAAPNFMLAAKGPDGSLAVASRQASYDGALRARGIHALQRFPYQDKDFCDGNACCISSIYHGGQLKMLTSHRILVDHTDDCPTYVMSQISAWALTSDSETFRKGARAYRNLRDWAKDQRDAAIQVANADSVVVGSAESDAEPVPATQSTTTSLHTEHLSDVDRVNGIQTETADSFVTEAITDSFFASDAEPDVYQTGLQKHPITPPRPTRPKRTRREAVTDRRALSPDNN